MAISRRHEQGHSGGWITPLYRHQNALQAKRSPRVRAVLNRSRGRWPLAMKWSWRVTLHTDRDMEYVHLKEVRAAAAPSRRMCSAIQISRWLGVLRVDERHHSHLHRLSPEGRFHVVQYACAQLRGKRIKPASPTSSAWARPGPTATRKASAGSSAGGSIPLLAGRTEFLLAPVS